MIAGHERHLHPNLLPRTSLWKMKVHEFYWKNPMISIVVSFRYTLSVYYLFLRRFEHERTHNPRSSWRRDEERYHSRWPKRSTSVGEKRKFVKRRWESKRKIRQSRQRRSNYVSREVRCNDGPSSRTERDRVTSFECPPVVVNGSRVSRSDFVKNVISICKC